jgi:hypothetical protein
MAGLQARVPVPLEFDTVHGKPIARRIGMESILNNPFIIPLGGMVMAIFIVAIVSMRKMRERELQAHQELRIREMEHERRLKEMEIEKVRLELEKARVGKPQ